MFFSSADTTAAPVSIAKSINLSTIASEVYARPFLSLFFEQDYLLELGRFGMMRGRGDAARQIAAALAPAGFTVAIELTQGSSGHLSVTQGAGTTIGLTSEGAGKLYDQLVALNLLSHDGVSRTTFVDGVERLNAAPLANPVNEIELASTAPAAAI